MRRILTSQPRWDEKRSYWKLNVQKDRVRRSFYSSQPGKKGKRIVEAKAIDWLENGTTKNPFLYDALQEFLAQKSKSLATGTYDMLQSIVRMHLKATIVNKRLSAVCAADWQKVLTDAAQKGLSKGSCGQYLSAIKRFITFCRMHKYPVDTESIDLIAIPSDAVGKKKKRSLQPKDIRTLFSSDMTSSGKDPLKDFYINAYRFCAVTGLRRGQLVGLEWSDISDDGVLSINRAINKEGETTTGKTDAARRHIYLPNIARRIIQDQRAHLRAHGIITSIVFPNHLGRRLNPNNLYSAWRRYCAYNNLPDISFHEIRHTTISMYRGSIDTSLLKEAVGHTASMDTFGVYGHEFDGKPQQAAAAMDGVLEDILSAK